MSQYLITDAVVDRIVGMRAQLRDSPLVENTYCVNQKDPQRGYDRRWKLNVMWADGSPPSRFDGPDGPTLAEDLYRRALIELNRRSSAEEAQP